MNELIEKRRSIRKYKTNKSVTREQLNTLLEAAMMAPSARNKRPWEFIAVTRREILDEIVRIHPYASMFATAQAAIIVVGIPQADIKVDSLPQDCGAATENILLQAVEMGLGTCWCGVYPREERIKEFRRLFSIPDGKVPFGVIAVGYPDEEPVKRGFFEELKVSYLD